MASPGILDGAARLEMLAERIARLHAQSGRDVLAARSRRALAESFAEFERALREVTAAAATPEARETYRLLRLLWDELRVAASQPSTADGARRLADRVEEVAWVAAKGVRLLHGQVPANEASERVLAAAAARSAAQRLAKLYLQRGWALPADAGAREAQVAEAQVQLGFARLRSIADADEAHAEALRVAEGQFELMRQAIARQNLEHIAKTADHIAETMDRVARRQAQGAPS